jgi:hypothetical protein
VLGSGVIVTAAGVTVIVSTKKSPLVLAFGVVIVTEVIGLQKYSSIGQAASEWSVP